LSHLPSIPHYTKSAFPTPLPSGQCNSFTPPPTPRFVYVKYLEWRQKWRALQFVSNLCAAEQSKHMCFIFNDTNIILHNLSDTTWCLKPHEWHRGSVGLARYTDRIKCDLRTQNYIECTLLRSLHTYSLSPCSTVLLEKLTSFQLVKKFPTFYGTRRFITAFTNARHLSLSWVSSIKSMPTHPTSWRSVFIYPPFYAEVFQVVSYPQVSPPKPFIRLYPICATWPAYLILLDFITLKILDEEYNSLSSSLCSFLHSLLPRPS